MPVRWPGGGEVDEKTNLAAQEAFGEAVNTGNLSAFDDLVDPNSVDHDPAPGHQAGPEGYNAFFTTRRDPACMTPGNRLGWLTRSGH